MLSACDAIDEVRPIARALVEREQRATNSRMAAYERVASRVGASPSWLRKLIGRQEVALAAHTYANIKQAYRRACERIEHEAEVEKQIFLALGANNHAADESLGVTGLLAASKAAEDDNRTP